MFDEGGRISRDGVRRLGWAGKHTDFAFKHHRYNTRYKRVVELIDGYLGNGARINVLPLAIGVAGWVPKFTLDYGARVLSKKRVLRLEKGLIRVTEMYALNAFNAGQCE